MVKKTKGNYPLSWQGGSSMTRFSIKQNIYIWFVPKLGIIFRSPMWKKVFCGGRYKKKWIKTKDVPFQSMNILPRKFEFPVLGVIWSVHHTPKVGCFLKNVKIQLFGWFITRLVKMLQQWPLYEVIEVILPFVLNTKRPLSDIWLLSYKQNSFRCFFEKI